MSPVKISGDTTRIARTWMPGSLHSMEARSVKMSGARLGLTLPRRMQMNNHRALGRPERRLDGVCPL